MTRFNISLKEGVELVLFAIENALGGEIFVPKIPSYKITDVAKAIAPQAKMDIVGIRPGEKLHEEIITETDSFYTIVNEKYFIILPSMSHHSKEEFIKHYNAKPVEFGFKYNSGTNDKWMTVEDIRSQIKEFVDPDFSI